MEPEPKDVKVIDDEAIIIDGQKALEKEVRVAMIGNVDSGKSTLVGVLTKCVLDDGRGSARQLIVNYSHEKETGRTSSITYEIMGFKGTKQIEPERATEKKNNIWNQVIKDSDKLVTIIDLCGHETYLKTTIFGLTGLAPDYAAIIVGANMGVQRMTKEHLGLALALKIPIFIVLTKVDIAPDDIYKQTLDNITKILKQPAAGKMPIIVQEKDDPAIYADNLVCDRVCPIFICSSVKGTGIDQLRLFMSRLKSRGSQMKMFKTPQDKAEFTIDGVFNVQTVGIVVSGTLTAGRVANKQVLMLGPDPKGLFTPVTIKSIHYKRVAIDEISCGNSCCFSIKSLDKKTPLTKESIRKGMVLVDKDSDVKAAWEFEADVMILHHATTIKEKYQSVIHCGVIRQTAQVCSMSTELLRAGDKGTIKFKFIKSPEVLHMGSSILFREGRTRGLGQISKIYY